MNKDLTLEINANTKQAISEINQLKQEIKHFTTNVDTSSNSLKKNQVTLDAVTKRVGALAVAFGGFEVVKGLVTTIADFEQSMARLGAVSGASANDLEKLKNKARELGETTQYSASQVSEAMNYQAMAGMKTNEIHLAVCGFIKLEKLRLNYKMNHFAIKEKIYIEALKVAYQKVEELQVA